MREQSATSAKLRAGSKSELTVSELVRDRVEVADERLRQLSLDDLLVVPRSVIAKVDVDGPVAVERDQRALSIVKHVEGLRIDPENLPDRVENFCHEPRQSIVATRDKLGPEQMPGSIRTVAMPAKSGNKAYGSGTSRAQ